MNIVHINSYFISNTLHYELVKELANHNQSFNQWIYVALNKNEKVKKGYPVIKNVEFLISPIFSTFQRYVWPLKIITTYKDFLKKTNALNFDVTHSHSLISNGILSFMYFKKTGIPYIITVRNTDINIFMKKSVIFRWLGFKILKSASAIIVLSPAYKELQLKNVLSSKKYSNIEHKIKIIPNGVDNFWIENKYLKSNNNDELQILFVGKLRENKNILGLIEACKILKSKEIKFTLHIVGDGYLMNKVLDATASFSCSIHGFVSDKKELLEIYRMSDVLVVPSYKESFGLIYVEAMTQSLPVIYTKGQGFDGNFPDGQVGYAIEPKSPQNISEAILKTKTNLKKMSKNAYEEADRFSWQNNATLLDQLYNSVL